MEQRTRDAGKGGTKESENVVRECKALAEEELWSGCTHCPETGQKINQGGLEEAGMWN